MQIRPLHIVVTAAVALVLTGCNGPGKHGIEARQNARNRINQFSASATYDMAMQDFRAGQFEKALGTIDTAIMQAPERPRFYVARGRILLESDHLEAAVESLNEAIALDEEYAEPHYFLGIVYQRWSDDEQAYDHYRRAWELEGDNVEYLLATAESLLALGEFGEARTLVEARLDYFEHNPALRHLLGQIALLEGDPTAAAELYGEVRMLQPDNIGLLEELAWVQYEAGFYSECLDSLETLQAEFEEDRVDLQHLEARCLTMLERSADAHAAYMQLSRKNPTNPSIWIEFGTLAWKVGDYRRVAECSARTTAMAPDRYEGYLLRGQFERHSGRMNGAVDQLRRSADLAIDTVLPHLLLGQTYEEMGNSEAALSCYAEAMAAEPDNDLASALHTALEESMIATAETD